MTLDRLLGKVALLSGLSLFGYNCDSATLDSTSCVKDTDCKGERVCDSNTKMCVEYTPATQTKYTCETYCNNLVECCKIGPSENYNTCISDLNDGPPKKSLQEELQGCIQYCEKKIYSNYDWFKCFIDNQVMYKCDPHFIELVCNK